MTEFKDSEGRRWTIRLTLGDVKRVMDECGVNLLNFAQLADESYTTKLIADDLFVAEILAALLKKQAEKYGVDALEALDGATMKAAQEAFLTEYAFFFKDRGNKAAETVVVEALKATTAILDGATSAESQVDAV